MKDESQNFPWHLTIVAVATCAGLTVAAYALGVQPMLHHRANDQAQRTTLEQRQADLSERSASVANLQRDLADAKQSLARTPVRLQAASLVNQRLEAVASVATKWGVFLDEMRPGSAVDSTHYQTVPIRIVGNGTFPACATFLRELRQEFGDIGVQTFQLTNNGADSTSPTATLQAELVWFTELPRK
jgi:Tfp pilus assembly protein PilO